MQPYYSDDAVTIYHGDCRELLPGLGADVLVTDPPYGVDFQGKYGAAHGGYTSGDSDIGVRVVTLVLPLVTRAAVFTGRKLLHAYPPPADIGGVFNPAGAGFGAWGAACFHPVAFYGPAPGHKRPTSLQSSALAENDLGHPCPKPLRWLTWLVGLASLPGETVLDPFAGSGTTLRAAKDLGRKAIGIEIEERYCEIAANRCRQEVLDLSA